MRLPITGGTWGPLLKRSCTNRHFAATLVSRSHHYKRASWPADVRFKSPRRSLAERNTHTQGAF